MFGGRREEMKSSKQELNVLIGAGCVFEGNIKLPEGLSRIDGEILGNVSGDGGVIIGEKGVIKGNINLNQVIVYGKVEGDIYAKSVELRAGSYVIGNLITEELYVEKGAIFNGQCKMGQKGAESPLS